MTISNLRYPFGEAQCYERYTHFKFWGIDMITAGMTRQILRDLDSLYKSTPYIFISERDLKTIIDPKILRIVDPNRMIGLAIVSEDEENRRRLLAEEQQYYAGSFAFFNTPEEAVSWVDTFSF